MGTYVPGAVTYALANYAAVPSNAGNAFTASSGTFTAPRVGSYYFTGYAQVAQGQIGGGAVVYAFIIGPSASCRTQLNQITGSDSQTTPIDCLLSLASGDQVRLYYYVNGGGSYLLNSYRFSGFFVGS